jgi:glycosyltransferase involved in cell wall biosynthesis
MNPEPCLSVVIPTRDRLDVLRDTLDALDGQVGMPRGFEVVVVDDGSSDGTAGWLADASFETFVLHHLRLTPGGPARARNRGIAAAAADRVLVLGDDTAPEADTLARHLEEGGGRPTAVQGRIDWNVNPPVTEVMDFLAPQGPQFYFKGLEHGAAVPYTAVLGSNLSAPTEWFRREPYDERFTEACLEDTELAWRWSRRGWTAVWSETARCRHRHRYDAIEPFLDRQRRAGRWARLAVVEHPGMLPRLVLQPVAFAAVSAFRLAARRRRRDRWDLQCRLAFARGFLLG